ncbi:MAG: hypothetical protein JSS57_07035 [Proteobacteria bacterium]|nr:hypothetical protein [Pseudomonadota bacterium]
MSTLRPRLTRRPHLLLAITMALAVLIATALVWLYAEQQRDLTDVNRRLETVRLARTELAKGFLYASLGDADGSPFRSEQGLALLRQAAGSLAATVSDLETRTPTPADELQRKVRHFEALLADWRHRGSREPQREVGLLIAYHDSNARPPARTA